MSVNGHMNGHANGVSIRDDTRPLIVHRRGREIWLPPITRALLTARQIVERKRLLAGRYFLVNMRLGDVGEVFRCGRCNGKHSRLTLYCLDRPFSGLAGGLYGFVQTMRDAEAAGRLSGEVAERISRIRRIFHETRGLPDLETGHPQLARSLQQATAASAAGPRLAGAIDLDIGVVSLGLLERIESKEAQRLLDRINLRATAFGAQPLVVPGLKGPDS